ncbi:DUF5906 domain-containing protein [Thalassotalea sp. Y01]|uniref:DUF5906 domain-containing protein n=1 Tax=Thalassotalea sp. Y01 TaxID=2729613 RepID=UPI00145C4332|nr:DUF5906 domain-containing protein [Thalassotalea sp. Y01]NMP15168.1 integrase [Thalassotalea sp. Y01]
MSNDNQFAQEAMLYSSSQNSLTETTPLTGIAPMKSPVTSITSLTEKSHTECYGFINNKPLMKQDSLRLQSLNEKYCHVSVGGKHKVVSKKVCPVDGESLYFENLAEFKSNFLHEPKMMGLNLGDAWLTWEHKKFKPGGISFYPNPNKCPMDVYNVFGGFIVEPVQGDVEPFLNHVQNIICNGDKLAYDYVIGFFAHLVQKPDEKPSVAIVLKSIEGTGKGTLVEPIMRILGNVAAQVNGAYQLTGRFNSVVANKLLIFADEVELTDKRSADKLKGLISEPRISLEKKGLDVIQIPNYCRFIFASNHHKVLNAGSRERRYLVLEPSSTNAQNKDYFSKLWGWINNGGAQYLFHYLLNYDLSGFDPRRAPITKALLEEKLANLSPIQEFIYNELLSEKPFNGQVRIETVSLTEQCQYWLERNNYTFSAPQVRSALGKLMNTLEVVAIGKSGRGAYYELPDKEDFQRRFAVLLGHEASEIF